MHGLNKAGFWTTETAFKILKLNGLARTKSTTDRQLKSLGVLTDPLRLETIRDELDRKPNKILLNWAINMLHSKRSLILYAQICKSPDETISIQLNDSSSNSCWVKIKKSIEKIATEDVLQALRLAQKNLNKKIGIFPHGELVRILRDISSEEHIDLFPSIYPPILIFPKEKKPKYELTPHLKRLEAESIFIFREAVAESENPAMLYSIGKDSSVMLHLAKKAFYPSPPPFPLLHVDTQWKFQEMYLFRDHVAKMNKMELIIHTNPEIIRKNVNPFDHSSNLYIDITKIEGLKQVIDEHKFDLLFGGARRDEEKSRAKERIFSFRDKNHRWDPKNQRPELWNLYNTKINKGENIRVFPLSNWTELDIWQYIYLESIPIVPLYFAKKRPVVIRNGTIIMIDDDRFRLMPNEVITEKIIRFRSLGCYPYTGATESLAKSLADIILELASARNSERQGRVVDHDSPFSMENKKMEGHF